MNIDFLFILVAFTFISALIYVVDRLFWKKGRVASQKEPLVVEYSRSFFPIFLIVLIIRSFVGQIFHVPTGSLAPSVMPGDFILVTQYNYGLRLPVVNKKILSTGEIKHGDIVVFAWPVNPQVNFVKRAIGLPGDSISYINNVLYVNGKMEPQTFVGDASDSDGDNKSRSWPVKIMQENFEGVKHNIYLCATANHCPSITPDFYNVIVPPGMYFMMGDNRDNSEDSRNWGFVSDRAIIGKARFVLLGWSGGPVWSRIGNHL